MKTICPYCDQEYPETPDEYLGQSCECQNCHQDFVVEKAVICIGCGAANAKSATKCRRCGRIFFRTRTVSSWQKVSSQHPAAVPPTRPASRTSAATGRGSSRKPSIWTKKWGSSNPGSFLASVIAFLIFFAWKNGQFEKKNARTPKYPVAAQTRTSSSGTQRAAAQTRQSSNDGGTALEKGLRYCNEKNYVEAVKWFRTAAEQGDAEGQYYLGCCYELGFGVERNRSEADKWYFKAKEQGHKDGLRAYMEGLWRVYGH